MCGLTSMTAQASWTARARVPRLDRTLRVVMRFNAEGRPARGMTYLLFEFRNRTNSPVSILWNESSLRLANGQAVKVVPSGEATTTTVVPAGSSVTVKPKPARLVPGQSVAEWLRSIPVIWHGSLVLSLTIEAPEGKLSDEWTWNFLYREDEQVVETESDHTIWLTVATVAAVLLGIFVLLST